MEWDGMGRQGMGRNGGGKRLLRLERHTRRMAGGSLTRVRTARCVLQVNPGSPPASYWPGCHAQYSYPLVSWMLTTRERVQRNLQQAGGTARCMLRQGASIPARGLAQGHGFGHLQACGGGGAEAAARWPRSSSAQRTLLCN